MNENIKDSCALEDYILVGETDINKNITHKKAPSYCKHTHTNVNKGKYKKKNTLSV